MSGTFLAVVTLFGWGFADFFTQRAARQTGIAALMFFSGIFGLVILFPFAERDFQAFNAHPSGFLLLGLASVAGIVAALCSLEAFRRGKLAVVEPAMGLELPFTVLLAVLIRGERLSAPQMLLMLSAFIGILAAATPQPLNERLSRASVEKGAMLGLLAAISLGFSNFTFAVASQEVSPVMAVWFGRAVITLIFGAYLVVSRRFVPALVAVKKHLPVLVLASGMYIGAFLTYGAAARLATISVVTTISESYIVLGVLLGVVFNKERLTMHQYFGAGIVVASIFALGVIG